MHLDVLEVLLDERCLYLGGGPSIIIAGCHTRVVHQVLMRVVVALATGIRWGAEMTGQAEQGAWTYALSST